VTAFSAERTAAPHQEETVVEFKHILCPIDFSETSIRALTYATAFATWYEAPLGVLHVVPLFEDTLPLPDRGSGDPDVLATREAIIEATHGALLEAGAAGFNPTIHAQEGRVHKVIRRSCNTPRTRRQT
jgi:nucleotide-binding universal stress UspA family protein